MGTIEKKGLISPRDLLLRESTLSDYLGTWVGQAASLVSVMRLNYRTSFLPLSDWECALVSLEHQMAARSQLLSSMAIRDGSNMPETRMSYLLATATCWPLFEVKHD